MKAGQTGYPIVDAAHYIAFCKKQWLDAQSPKDDHGWRFSERRLIDGWWA